MTNLKIDLRTEVWTSPESRSHRPWKFAALAIGALVTFGVSFGIGRVSLTQSAEAAWTAFGELPIISQMHLVSSGDRRLAGEADDRINVLLMGMGGAGHEGPLLTDTIIVASIRPSDRHVAMMSIPRDLVVPLGNRGWRKINSANAFGEMDREGTGAEYARTTLEGLLGIDIPYYVRIDFAGFEKIIDDVGGIDVTVDRTFSDSSYPAANYLYQTIRFEQGVQHLDGDTALKFARSRHGNNGEGSDFARGKRQQKVLAALKDKLMDDRNLRNPVVVANLLASMRTNVATNLQVGELLRLAKMAKDVDQSKIANQVIDDRPGSPLVSSYMNGAYVLVPRNDDWSLLRSAAANLFETAQVANDGTSSKATTPAAGQAAATTAPSANAGDKTSVKPALVEIQNGSGVSGIARNVSSKVSAKGFKIAKIGNADAFNYRRTVLVDLTDGKRAMDLEKLRAALGQDVELTPARDVKSAASVNADFLVIIGQDIATAL